MTAVNEPPRKRARRELLPVVKEPEPEKFYNGLLLCEENEMNREWRANVYLPSVVERDGDETPPEPGMRLTWESLLEQQRRELEEYEREDELLKMEVGYRAEDGSRTECMVHMPDAADGTVPTWKDGGVERVRFGGMDTKEMWTHARERLIHGDGSPVFDKWYVHPEAAAIFRALLQHKLQKVWTAQEAVLAEQKTSDEAFMAEFQRECKELPSMD